MSKANFIIRVLSPRDGTKRVDASEIMNVGEFLDKVKKEFGLSDNGWRLCKDRGGTGEITPSRTKLLSSYKLKHGDMLYLSIDSPCGPDSQASNGATAAAGSSRNLLSAGALLTGDSEEAAKALNRDSRGTVIEDEVDRFLSEKDGKIERNRNDKYCRHGSNSKCVHCVPYEPYDEEYLAQADPPIKFLSFHSYMRKLTGGVDKGKFAVLENISCKIKPGCTDHPPWPAAACTKCKPKPVTLMRQKYRHVDYIQFENRHIIDRFLNYWRKTGDQRLGYMYGRYEHHTGMPLGIKAVVTAIYEPRQIGTKSSIELVEDEDETVNQIAASLHLQKIGWIFTDLLPLDLSKGTVKQCRGDVNSHFLSAEECIMAADLQNRHPNPCKLSPEGHFGSKFVTVVVTGDSSNQIHFEGYQVSNQCMALVRDDCLIPTKDAPELGYIKESSSERFVPDVFYKGIDGYGNEVTRLGRPLPVEYLLVDLPAAFPLEPLFTFYASADVHPFIIEHRDMIGEIQDFNAFCTYMRQFKLEQYPQALNDLHVLAFIATCDVLPLKDQLPDLLDALQRQDEVKLHGWFKSEAWMTVEQLIESNTGMLDQFAENSGVVGNGGTGAGAGGNGLACAHCTYINPPGTNTCSMCGLPLSGAN